MWLCLTEKHTLRTDIMAGIAGIVHFDDRPIDGDVLKAMTVAAAHRGPDGITYRHGERCSLAHLALNTTTAQAPSSSPLHHSRGARHWLITADARIDNREDLCATLGGVLCPELSGAGDTGLILAAYLKWEGDCATHLIGDFAFAVWDDAERTLYCARDALGLRPLHYASWTNGFCFASEAQQLIQHPSVGANLDEQAIADCLVDYPREEALSFFESVRRLPRGHTLVARPGMTELYRYWRPENLPETRFPRPEAYAERFRELFSRAVADRIQGVERPAVSLSGGLDSASVATVAHRLRSSQGLRAFSYVFDRLPECDERVYSRCLNDQLGLVIEPVPIERYWLLSDPDAYRPQRESPFLGFVGAEQHLHRRCQEDGIRVLFSGHGGDSLLTGSARSWLDRLIRGDLTVFRDIHRHARHSDTPITTLIKRHLVNPLIPTTAKAPLRAVLPGTDPALPPWLSDRFAQRLRLSRRVRQVDGSIRIHGGFARRLRINEMFHLGAVARAVYYLDRTASPYGVEYRHPFLDRRLVEYTLSVPDEQLFRAVRTKLLLRAAMGEALPATIRERTGKTYPSAFVDYSLRTVSAERIDDLFVDPLSARLGYTDRARLRHVWQRFRAGSDSVSGTKLWVPISLELWLRELATAPGV